MSGKDVGSYDKNRRMKHVVAASLAFGAAALTGFGQIAPAAVYAAEQTETVKTEKYKKRRTGRRRPV